ncbi:hypothetical protein C2S51_016678 [Perilla frutescens var. frutescens]|nr:hypothetical protein C2S51_016678 [Perilla frutescens var. frutescens]
MNCKFAQSGPKSAAHTIPKPNQYTKARIPESVSFASRASKPIISIENRSGPRGARYSARIAAFYDVTAGTAGSPYEVLGIDESVSSIRDIKKAYKKMAIKYHPDVSPPDRVDENTGRFIMVKRAYETLTNPQRRASHDAGAHDERTVEKEEWKMKWQSQLDELKRRSKNISRSERVSWGARMRAQS